MKDIRIYYYEAGMLKKLYNGRKGHKYTSITEALGFIDHLVNSDNPRHSPFKDYQFVLVKYYNKYDSKIIKIVN